MYHISYFIFVTHSVEAIAMIAVVVEVAAVVAAVVVVEVIIQLFLKSI